VNLETPRLGEVWSALAGLAGRETGDREFLTRLLELAARQRQGEVAVYLKGERGGYRREASSRDGIFDDGLAQPPAGDRALRFDGGFVLWSSAASEPRSGESVALELLVATAARELRLRDQLKRRDFEAKTQGVQLEALYDVGLAIASTLDFEKLCDEIQVRAVSLLDARRGALYLRDADHLELHCVFGGEAVGRLPLPGAGAGAGALDGLEMLPGAAHVLAVPISLDGQPRGLLVVGDKEQRRGVGPFPESDRRTLDLLANQAAIALENAELHRQALEKERLVREMELASDIQRRILPKGVPDIDGYELVGWNRPARHVGGDYFDFFRLADDRLGVVVGDVSGKGVPAALLVSTLHSALRLLVDRISVGPELFFRLNQHVLESSTPNKFITLILCGLDPASGDLTFVNAGHNPGVVVRASGAIERLGPGGLPLGLLPGVTWRPESMHLDVGDLLCLYSDGITEASSPADEEFGLERLVELLCRSAARPLDEVLAAIDGAVTSFSHGLPQGDDQTVVMLRRAR
jgi:sigma-B regulation protein RsbU (phosphoserine phosphatase)